MRTIRLTLAYDGTNYVGWQVQPNGPSVQSAVEQALLKLTGDNVRVLAAGRTDSGVHALGQVVSFRTTATLSAEAFQHGLQHFLPDDIVVREAAEAADDFHATYSAKRKRYRYVIHNSRVPDPFVRRYAWRIGTPLAAEAMDAAAGVLVGTHDFRCFESQFPNKATSVRTVFEASVQRVPGWATWRLVSVIDSLRESSSSPDHSLRESSAARRGSLPESTPARPDDARDFVCFEIAADGFLYNMVRAITGTLVKVGLGAWTVDDVRKIVASQDRARAGETAPPVGLFLVSVEY
jgi:tRNA pseudouridine38-40 synthase